MVEVHTFAVQKSLQLSRRVLQGVPAQDLQEKKEDLVRPVWQRHVQGTKLLFLVCLPILNLPIKN